MVFKRKEKKEPRNRFRRPRQDDDFNPLEAWKPISRLGKSVKSGEVTNIGDVISSGKKILEAEIVDSLIPNLDSDFMLAGQSKGKFGGGKRRIFRQTQKKTAEGNKPIFSVIAAVGNKNGYVGVGLGKSKETMPAREKALRAAKLNLMQIARGCGSWECTCGTSHSIPFKLKGRCGSVRLELMPAPRGTGLVVEKDLRKILSLAGIEDVWSKTSGQTNSRSNLVEACMKALRSSTAVKVKKGMAVARYGEVSK